MATDALRAAMVPASEEIHDILHGGNGTWKTRNEADVLALRALQAVPAELLAKLAAERSGAAAGATTPVCPHIETSDEGTSHCTLAVAGATTVAPPTGKLFEGSMEALHFWSERRMEQTCAAGEQVTLYRTDTLPNGTTVAPPAPTPEPWRASGSNTVTIVAGGRHPITDEMYPLALFHWGQPADLYMATLVARALNRAGIGTAAGSSPTGTPPGEPLESGFDYRHARDVPEARLSDEARERVLRKMDSVDEARRRAAEGASSFAIGSASPAGTPTKVYAATKDAQKAIRDKHVAAFCACGHQRRDHDEYGCCALGRDRCQCTAFTAAAGSPETGGEQ